MSNKLEKQQQEAAFNGSGIWMSNKLEKQQQEAAFNGSGIWMSNKLEKQQQEAAFNGSGILMSNKNENKILKISLFKSLWNENFLCPFWLEIELELGLVTKVFTHKPNWNDIKVTDPCK